ncbi:MAG: hypothetical protein WBA23_02965 [Tunicatimonas sp.]|uniref:hypothetical protein n=1 Tax=Tunicatimonas sp. TaxID=1940096 RepID=UPI003C766A9C
MVQLRSFFAICIVTIALGSVSCTLKPVASENYLIKNNLHQANIDSLGDGKILIYNGADPLLMGNDDRMNIWINGKPLGQLRSREYTVVDVGMGDCEFNLARRSLFLIKSNHTIKINPGTKVVSIDPVFVTNTMTQTNKLPSWLEKYAYVKSPEMAN